MKTKILFINAINPYVEVEKRQPSLGIGYLASSLRKEFGDGAFEFLVVNSSVDKTVREFRPDLVFISSVTQNFDIARGYARRIKEAGIPVIVGGIHITMMPSSLDTCFDAGVIGEGECAVVELTDLYMKEKGFTSRGLAGIKGLVYRQGEEIIYTEPRPPIEDLDKISPPARDLLEIHDHTYMFTSRGCPYKCTFCASTRFWSRVRFFSAEYVVREMRDIADKYNASLISFYDDLFIADHERLKKIASMVKNDKKLKKLKFTCSARANLVTDEVVGYLKEMNVKSINLGLESGCERTLRYLKGGNVTVENNMKAIKTVKKHKLACQGSFILGSPTETREEMMQTYDFIKKAPLNILDVYVLTPYPGTPVWDYALKRGVVSEDMDWGSLNVNFASNADNAIILSEVLSKEEMIGLFKKFSKLRFFKNIKGVITHPYFKDIPKMAVQLLIERVSTTLKAAFKKTKKQKVGTC